MFFRLFLFFLIVHTLHSTVLPNGKDVERLGQLISTSLIYRHGDRNPAGQYPGDLYDISYWPEGWGQLTTLGKQQQFALGQWTRQRYRNFLSTNFNVNDALIRSSDVDRTLMSAMSNLAGLYPPTGKQVWNKDVKWQPIPVHTVPESVDYLTVGILPPCKAYDNAFDAYLQSDKIKKVEASNQPIYDYLTSSIGVPINNYMTVLSIRDGLFIESLYNLTLPAWSKAVFPNNQKFNDVAMQFYLASTGTKFLAKFRSGFLLKDILDRYKAKVARTLSPDVKYVAYSSHDSVVASFLDALGVFDNKFVPYTACILVELRYYKNEYYIQLYYKNSDKTPEAINIPNCGTACPLSRMYQIYDEILPKNDFITECNIGVATPKNFVRRTMVKL